MSDERTIEVLRSYSQVPISAKVRASLSRCRRERSASMATCLLVAESSFLAEYSRSLALTLSRFSFAAARCV